MYDIAYSQIQRAKISAKTLHRLKLNFQVPDTILLPVNVLFTFATFTTLACAGLPGNSGERKRLNTFGLSKNKHHSCGGPRDALFEERNQSHNHVFLRLRQTFRVLCFYNFAVFRRCYHRNYSCRCCIHILTYYSRGNKLVL